MPKVPDAARSLISAIRRFRVAGPARLSAGVAVAPRVPPAPGARQTVTVADAQVSTPGARHDGAELEDLPPPPPPETDEEALQRLQLMQVRDEAAQMLQQLPPPRAAGLEQLQGWSQTIADMRWINAHVQSIQQDERAVEIAAYATRLESPHLTSAELEQVTKAVIEACSKWANKYRASQASKIDYAALTNKLLDMHFRVDRHLPTCDAFSTLVAAAARQLHAQATGQRDMAVRWNAGDPLELRGAPERPLTPVDLIACMRAARFHHLHQAMEKVQLGVKYRDEFTYASGWSLAYKEKIPLVINAQDLTPAELERLKQPGEKPEWNWLPGLQAAAENAAVVPLKQQVGIHLPQADPDLHFTENRSLVSDLVAQYAQPYPGGLKDEGC